MCRENKLARERRSAGAVCFDEGAHYEGYAPAAPGGGRFIPRYLPRQSAVFCEVSPGFTATPLETSEATQNQCVVAVKPECMNALPIAWLFL